jgi:hypothetical protein
VGAISYSTLPSSERRTTTNVQPLDLRLPPRPRNVLQHNDLTYDSRQRNRKQLQDELMTEPHTGKQNVAAIDGMARRQLGFGNDTPALGPPQLRPMDVSNGSLHANAHCAAFQCQFGRNDSKGSGFVGTRAMCAKESISLRNIVIGHIR